VLRNTLARISDKVTAGRSVLAYWVLCAADLAFGNLTSFVAEARWLQKDWQAVSCSTLMVILIS